VGEQLLRGVCVGGSQRGEPDSGKLVCQLGGVGSVAGDYQQIVGPMEVSSGTLLGLLSRWIPKTIRSGRITRRPDAAIDRQPQTSARTMQTKIVLGAVEPLKD
jgi:hypothetical protein